MYYDNNPGIVELHDDVVGIEKAVLEKASTVGKDISTTASDITNLAKLTVTFLLNPHKNYTGTTNADGTVTPMIYSTNGVDHRLLTSDSLEAGQQLAQAVTELGTQVPSETKATAMLIPTLSDTPTQQPISTSSDEGTISKSKKTTQDSDASGGN